MNASNENKTLPTQVTLRLENSELQRAAERLSAGGDLKKVLTQLNNEYIQTLRGTSPDETLLREELYYRISSFDDLLNWVEAYGKRKR
jgi:hypothetical protein